MVRPLAARARSAFCGKAARRVAAHQDLRQTEAELCREMQKCLDGSGFAGESSPQAAADARGEARSAFEGQLTELRDLTKMCALLVAGKPRQGGPANSETARSASADAARSATRRPRPRSERAAPRAEEPQAAEGADDREEQLMEAQGLSQPGAASWNTQLGLVAWNMHLGLVAQILVDFRDALARADADLAADEAVAAAEAGAARRSVAAA
jgi:hypothetical protein